MQLLLLEAVPVIKELQFPAVDEDCDSEMEESEVEIERLWTLKLDIVWKVDGKPTVHFKFVWDVIIEKPVKIHLYNINGLL